MAEASKPILRGPDLRILALMIVGVAAFGFVDGSLWKTLLTPTIAYRPAILFALSLAFGWRGFFWSQVLLFAAFGAFHSWQGILFMAPMYLASQLAGFIAARKIAGNEPWFSGERSALALLAGAALAPAAPALFVKALLIVFGVSLPAVPAAVDSWLRGTAGILALAPAVLVHGSGRLQRWVGLPAEQESRQTMGGRNFLELGLEIAVWAAALWGSVVFKARYNLDITYLTFLPPLAFTLLRGMRLATLALAANAIVATTLWSQLHWASSISAADLRLLISLYSATILVLAAAVEERERGKSQVGRLLTDEAALRESERRFRTVADSAPVMIWVSGLDRLCTFFNQPWLDFTGRSMQQELGNGWAEGVHPEDLESCLNTYISCFDARRPFQMEYRLRRADGEYRWIQDNGTPLYGGGEFDGYIGSCIDVTDQTRTQRRLRVSEAGLKEAQRLAKIGSWERDLEDGTSVWSEEMFSILGIHPGERPDFQLFLSRVHPEDREKVMAAARNFEASTEASEYRIVRADGEVRFVRTISELIRNHEGKPVHLRGATQDITELKQTGTALRESEARLTLAQNAAQIGVWVRDFKTNLVTISGQYAQLHGLSPDRTTITREEWLNLIHPDDRERIEALRQEGRERTHTFDAEFRIIWPEGSTHWVHAKGTVLIDDSGRPAHSMGVIWDITEGKHAEAALRESEERFRRVFEEGPLGLALVGTDYRFVKVNSALCQMVGYSETELSRMSFPDVTYPEDLPADLELAERLFRREVPFYRIQKRYIKKSGEIIWINLTASIVFDEDGKPLHGIAMIEDVTEIKRAQEETLARQKLESLGTLASGIAHDFNNLLGGVLAQAELALGELAAGSRPEDELKAIRDVALRGSEIVRELMVYAGKETTAEGLADGSRIVREMLQLLSVSVSKHAVIETDLRDDIPAVRASAAQLRQIVMNLVTNASEAIGGNDGAIRVTTKYVRVGRNSHGTILDGLADGNYLQLEVSDTGGGMSSEMQIRAFDPFFTTKSAGRGLGLAVVQGIVRGLQGSIDLTTELGKGTTFRILLPCADTRAAETHDPTASGHELAHPFKGQTALIVEDEAPLRRPVAIMLRKNGFEVYEAADGSSAIDLLRANGREIDVIVLDMTIPGPSSREVVVEAAKVRPDISVILTSAYSREMIAGAMDAPQIRDFVRKPYTFGDLLQALRNVCP
ncbi:MAG TPA: PAS domain S-box protein [Bryobacteraceae bacterium]